MIELTNDYEEFEETTAVELRVTLSREVLTAGLYDLGMSAEDLADYTDDEVRVSAMASVVFEGHGAVQRRAEKVFADYRAGKLNADLAEWWRVCSERIGVVFFGAPERPAAIVASDYDMQEFASWKAARRSATLAGLAVSR